MDESRKAFERWWEVNCHNGQPPRHGWDFWRDGEGYSIEDDEEFQWRWEAWQASRSAIEIELPEATAYWNGTKGNEVLNHRQLMADTADAIRAAGIKVKE